MNKLMTLLHENDVLILPGGADIDPSLYGKENYKSWVSGYSLTADLRQADSYRKAMDEGRPVFGICRGMQLASALNNLTLIQDISHPGGHRITVRDINSKNDAGQMYVNSLHHQLVWTENKLDAKDYTVYGYCALSDHHDYQENEKIICTVEPEIIYFPKTRTIGVQFHPEMMSHGRNYDQILDYLYNLVQNTILK